ncbi:hypothetical protein J008_05082 [Cryptococcus neoformans]|nr:hypothetical protein C362_05368 [Cryptococcus neoformans var. grubii Bt1]OXG17533.1 hypothetical protein C367_05019 [Cryptococcus neoformans var. grubii Ze90-1]OXH26278.1 hypothetical protein J008_05082 [Cryptococcus neoformans var. grubii]
MTLNLDERGIPKTLPHVFDLELLAKHFQENPLPPGACKLIDLPGDVFLDTEDDINVVAAALWVLAVKYDNLPSEERPSHREESRKWLIKHRGEVIERLTAKIEPPFHAFTLDLIYKDVAAMLDELLANTLPEDKKEPATTMQK